MGFLNAMIDAGKIYNFEQVFGVKDLTTAPMQQAIADWYGLYYNGEPTGTEDPAQRLPVAVVSKLYKGVFSEYNASATKPYVQTVLDALGAKRKKAVQQMLIGGQCFLKPIFWRNSVRFCVISRQNYLTLGVDGNGAVTDIGTSEVTEIGRDVYTLLERRSVDAAGYLTIESRLFRAGDRSSLGVEVPLATLDKYADLVPVLRYNVPVWSIGLIPLRCPAENCVDGSTDAVSVYAAASGLIHSINRNEAQINTEFSNGESRLIVPETMLRRRPDGSRGLDAHVFVGAPPNIDGQESIYAFSPALREQSFLARKTEYLRNIESLIGFKRGILSDVEAAEKTATEITSSAGEYNLTIKDFQDEWERCVRETVRVCAVLGSLYKLPVGGAIDPEKDVSIDWGNGILYDEDKEWATLMQLVSAGLLKPEIALAWKYDLPWDTPAELAAIRAKYMPEKTTENGGDEA